MDAKPTKISAMHGELMRELRLARGLDATQFARKAGVSRSMVSRWENGMVPRPATVTKIVEALDEVLPLSDGERRRLLAISLPRDRSAAIATWEAERGASDADRAALLASWLEELIEGVGIDQVLELLYVSGGLAGVNLPGRRFVDQLQPGDQVAWSPGSVSHVYVVPK
ncbi:MAG: helix-turn-helix transcriptional regulator [Planctomycetota bacterium]